MLLGHVGCPQRGEEEEIHAPRVGQKLVVYKRTAMKGVGILFGSIKKSVDFLQKISFRLTEMMIRK